MGEIEELKKELESLLESIKSAQQKVGDTKLSDVSKAMSDVPKMKMITRRVMKGHLGKVNAVDFTSDCRQLVSAGLDGKLFIWDTWTGNKIHVISPRSSWVMTAAISASGNLVSCGGMDNMCTIYDLNARDENGLTGKLTREFVGLDGFLSCSRFIDDKKVITGSADMRIILWDIETGKNELEFYGHDGDVMSLSLYQKETFVTGSVDKTAKIWDIREGKCKQTFWGHESDVNSVSFHRSGQAFATASEDKTSRFFDLRGDQEIGKYSVAGKECGLTSCSLSLSGRIVLCGSDDGDLHAWDTMKQQYISRMAGHESRITSICMSENGMALASASWDSSVRLWLYA